MAEEKMMRLSLAGKKLNVGITTIVEKLSTKGHSVENNPNAKLNYGQLQLLAKEFNAPSLLEDGSTKPVEEPRLSSRNNDDVDILYFREQAVAKTTPKVEEKKEEKVVEVKVAPPAVPVKTETPSAPIVESSNDAKPLIASPTTVPDKLITPSADVPKVEISSKTEVKIDTTHPVGTKIELPKTEPIKPIQQGQGLGGGQRRDDRGGNQGGGQRRDDNRGGNQAGGQRRDDNRGGGNQAVGQRRDDNRGVNQAGGQRPIQQGVGNQAVGQRRDDNRGVNQAGGQRPIQQGVGNQAGGQRRDDRRPQQGQGGGQRPPLQQGGTTQGQAGGQRRDDNRGGNTGGTNQQRPQRRDEVRVPPPRVEIQRDTRVKADNVDDIEDDEDLPELIVARGEKLAGLKVLGKIELPVEKEKESGSKRKRKRKRVRKGEKVNNADEIAKAKDVAARKAAPGGSGSAATTSGGANNRHKKKERREEITESQVKDQIKQTMARLQTKGTDFGAKFRKEKRRTRADQEEQRLAAEEIDNAILKVTEYISAAELASMMDVSVNEVISACMGMGMFVSINQRLDAEAIQMISLEFGFDVEFISAEEEINSEIVTIEDKPEDLVGRAPIVTIMGHVDHGKTSLLDYIRRAKVAAGEAGGITQHIGAYSVTINEGENKGKKITFLDTPGHEAFTAMRARGAKITDVVIVVVAADDSVMPQTREAINHAQNAGVPIVFAINKIDKPGANPQKIREDLSKENILVESWGGKFQEQEISAKQGIGINELLDKVLLESELLELKANPNRNANGTIIEAMLDKGRGYVSTVMVETGTLKVGDIMLAGSHFGRVKAMMNYRGERIKEAGPATPVQVLGLPGAPQAGDKFNVMETDREAREIANKREQIHREQSLRTRKHITLEEVGRRKALGTFHELNVIVKGDVDGSVEALSDSLLKLSTDEVQVRIIHKAVGQISESDVLLASAADAVIVGFQVRPSPNARKIADAEQIEIRLYSIIYDAIEEIKDAMTGLLAPKVEEIIVGVVEVREVYKISKIGTVAGCYVTEGSVKRNNKIRVVRDGIVMHDGDINQLKRFKDDVNEVKFGFEFGLSIKGFHDILIGDTLESYELKETKRTL
jgi:translation initiation factor IF-2